MPQVIYSGTNQGIFKTTDGGLNWTRTRFPNLPVRAIGLDSQDAERVYAGTDCGAPPISPQDGIYKSEDGGDTWVQVGLYGARINAIAVHPSNSNIVYAGTGEAESSYPGEIVGIFKSEDGGDTWSEKLSEAVDAVSALLIDIDDPSFVYAGVFPGGSGPGLRRSENGGATWGTIQVGSSNFDQVVALDMNPAYQIQPNVIFPSKIYAVVLGSDVYFSSNKGNTWAPTGAPRVSSNAPWSLTVDPRFPFDVYLGTRCDIFGCANELYRNVLGNWSSVGNGLPPGDPAGVVVDPQGGAIVVGLSEGGVYRTTDGAQTWGFSSRGMNGTLVKGLAVDPASPDRVVVSVEGASFHLAETTDAGSSWNYLADSPVGLQAAAMSPQSPSTIYVGNGWQTSQYFHIHKKTPGDTSWSSIPFLNCPNYCTTAVSSILLDSSDPLHILVGTLGNDGILARTSDGGTAWYQVGGSTTALAMNPNNHDIIYQGQAAPGKVFHHTGVWGPGWDAVEITPPEELDRVNDVTVDAASRVYAATDKGLWVLENTDWRKIGGLSKDEPTALAADRGVTPEALYVGTRGGDVFVSRNGGGTWTLLEEGPKGFAVTKLTVSGNTEKRLYAGTAFGGVWVHTSDVSVCEGDLDEDGDVDGEDLAGFAAGGSGLTLDALAVVFGSTDCS